MMTNDDDDYYYNYNYYESQRSGVEALLLIFLACSALSLTTLQPPVKPDTPIHSLATHSGRALTHGLCNDSNHYSMTVMTKYSLSNLQLTILDCRSKSAALAA